MLNFPLCPRFLDPMSFSRFHPIVQQWFTSTLGPPAPAQLRGWEAIHDRRHTLIAAPTGSGKTLAAFRGDIGLFSRSKNHLRIKNLTPCLRVSELKPVPCSPSPPCRKHRLYNRLRVRAARRMLYAESSPLSPFP